MLGILQRLTKCLSLMGLYEVVSLSPASDLSVFLIFYQGSDIYNIVEKKKNLARHFFSPQPLWRVNGKS